MRKIVLITGMVLLLMAIAVPLASAAPPVADGYWYTVHQGDTLTSIAHQHEVKVSHLIYANNIKNPDLIYVGQKLWIPGHGAPPSAKRVHIVKYGETLIGIAAQYGVSPWAIAQANRIYNLNRIYAGQRLYIP
jgi:LysM repeat protein